jgi:hypothetical protein
MLKDPEPIDFRNSVRIVLNSSLNDIASGVETPRLTCLVVIVSFETYS